MTGTHNFFVLSMFLACSTLTSEFPLSIRKWLIPTDFSWNGEAVDALVWRDHPCDTYRDANDDRFWLEV